MRQVDCIFKCTVYIYSLKIKIITKLYAMYNMYFVSYGIVSESEIVQYPYILYITPNNVTLDSVNLFIQF